MKDHYHIDFNSYTLKQLKKSIDHRDMIPSRQILKENLNENFKLFEKMGYKTVQDLLDQIKNPANMERFAEEMEIPEGYLKILKREINAFQPTPVKLRDLPDVDAKVIDVLESEGIKNSRNMFDECENLEMQMDLATRTALSLNEIEEVAGLSDLCRAYGVGPVFARLLYDIGIKDLKHLLSIKPEKIVKIYEEKTGKKADFGVNDLKLTLDIAKELINHK